MIILKDLIVLLITILAILSALGFYSSHYVVYLILIFCYITLRVSGKKVNVKNIDKFTHPMK